MPLPAKKTFVTGWGTTQVPQLAAGLTERGWTTDSLVTGATPTAATIASAVAKAQGSDQIVITTSAAWNSTAQQQLVAALRATGKPVLVVALRDAYDIGHLDGVAELPGHLLLDHGGGGVRAAGDHRGEQGPRASCRSTSPIPIEPGTVLYPFGTGLKK